MTNPADCSADGHRSLGAPDHPDAAYHRAVGIFRALGDEPRLRLLALLVQGEACVSELAAAGDEPVSTVSHRLRLLRGEGLVAGRRAGKHVYYRVADEHVAELVLNALDHATEARDAGTHRPPRGELAPRTGRA